MVSQHYRKDRKERERFIRDYLHGHGRVIDKFIVDKGHMKGIERHELTSKGVVLVRNAITNKLITKLIASPRQVKRYYEKVGKKPPRYLLNLAYKHQSLRWNEK